MSDATLVGDKDRKFKSPTDGRVLPVSTKVYKLKDRGEGQMRIVISAPIEALHEMDAALSWLEQKMRTEIPALNTLRVSVQKAKERCLRGANLKRLQVTQEGDGLVLTEVPFGDAPYPEQDITELFTEETSSLLPPPRPTFRASRAEPAVAVESTGWTANADILEQAEDHIVRRTAAVADFVALYGGFPTIDPYGGMSNQSIPYVVPTQSVRSNNAGVRHVEDAPPTVPDIDETPF